MMLNELKHTQTYTYTCLYNTNSAAAVGVGRLSGDAPATYLYLPNGDIQDNTVTDTSTLASYGRRIYLLYITETLIVCVIAVNKSGRANLKAKSPIRSLAWGP